MAKAYQVFWEKINVFKHSRSYVFSLNFKKKTFFYKNGELKYL